MTGFWSFLLVIFGITGIIIVIIAFSVGKVVEYYLANRTKLKVWDIAIGFFSWVILGNLAVVLYSFVSPHFQFNIKFLSLAIWLSTIIAILVLYTKKKFWECTGVVAAFLFNAGMFFITFAILWGWINLDLNKFILFAGIPMPMGLHFIKMQ